MMDLGCDEKNNGQVFGTAGYDSFLSTFQFGILGQATLTWGWRWEDVFHSGGMKRHMGLTVHLRF